MIGYPDLFKLGKFCSSHFSRSSSSALYQILLLEGNGKICVDFVEYEFSGKIALFTTPFQHISIKGRLGFEIEQLAFHGDFYCIEYHKKEVACNGLLFNNIYKQPFILLKDDEIGRIFENIRREVGKKEPYAEPILSSYLQLILAISSKIKKLDQQVVGPENSFDSIEKFKVLLEEFYIIHRKPAFYAEQLALSSNLFTKKSKKHFGKSPSQLIHERVILEAKKELHLTHKSIKEIAAVLNFDDEHYFSRYFKKHVGISPSYFRENVGISLVANLSMK